MGLLMPAPNPLHPEVPLLPRGPPRTSSPLAAYSMFLLGSSIPVLNLVHTNILLLLHSFMCPGLALVTYRTTVLGLLSIALNLLSPNSSLMLKFLVQLKVSTFVFGIT